LATVVGEIDVDAMLSRITQEQFDEWVAYDSLEPFGLVRQNRMIALITAALVLFKDGAEGVDVNDLYPLGLDSDDNKSKAKGDGKFLSPRATLARMQQAQAAATAALQAEG
jgi:hypothetical protein